MIDRNDLRICPVCKKVVNWKEELENMKFGGTGYCLCEYNEDERVMYDYRKLTSKEYEAYIESQI